MRPTPDDFERNLSALLDRARKMADTLYASLAVSYPNTFPESTVVRTIVATAPFYHAALLSLAERDSSLGALALSRPVRLFAIEGVVGVVGGIRV